MSHFEEAKNRACKNLFSFSSQNMSALSSKPFFDKFAVFPDLDVPKLSDSSMAIKEGSSLSVSCSAVASPAADFQWIFNSSIVVSSSNLLAIASVTRFSKGEYSCTATNPAGMTTSEILFLTVQCE